MKLWEKLKGVFRRMISPTDIATILQIQPAISSTMRDKINLWRDVYSGEGSWNGGPHAVKSLGIASMIASEQARMATLEMDVKITGESERAKYLKEEFEKVLASIRTELEFGIALGGLVVKPYVVKSAGGYEMHFTYTHADHFYPLSFSPDKKITDAAFIDRLITTDKIYSKLERHTLVPTDNGYKLRVTNSAYVKDSSEGTYGYNDTELGTPIPLTDVHDWAMLSPEVFIDTDKMLFTYFKMPQANQVDLESPLGVSGFSRAVDLIEDADKQYANLMWEFEGGQLAVDVDRTAFNVFKKDGKEQYILPQLQDRLFRRNLDLGEEGFYNVFSPSLRDASIINGLNNILVHIEDICNLSRGSLSFVMYSEARTATELKIVKQKSYAANREVQKELQRVLESTLDIMNTYCDLYKIVPQGEYERAFAWDDSIIIDKDAERQVDLLDVQAGLMSKVEYRMKWNGETEAQAIEALNKIYEQQKRDLELQAQFSGKTSDEQTTLERSNQSNKITKNI